MEGQILIELCKEHKISLKGNVSSQEEIAHELNTQVERRSKQLFLDQDGNTVQRQALSRLCKASIMSKWTALEIWELRI